MIATWFALKERYYSAVMAATGLLYLAILTAFGTDLVARAVLAAAVLIVPGLLAVAQTTAPVIAAVPVLPDAPATAASGVAEPAIRRTVIDDKGTHIEELRVRGQLQKVTVDNKGRAPNYEVLTHDGARDIADGGIVGLGGAAGKRVWNVLRF